MENILNLEEKQFKIGEKDYTIKAMNVVKVMEVLKLLPLENLVNAFYKMKDGQETGFLEIAKFLQAEPEKLILALAQASGIGKDEIARLMPSQFYELGKLVVEVNKPSFFFLKAEAKE